MAKADSKKETKKVKRPTALKRMLQSNKRRLQNRSTRSEVRTAIRGLRDSIDGGAEVEVVKEKLNKVYSLLDKGVKYGVYNANTCSRQKSRLTLKAAKVLA